MTVIASEEAKGAGRALAQGVIVHVRRIHGRVAEAAMHAVCDATDIRISRREGLSVDVARIRAVKQRRTVLHQARHVAYWLLIEKESNTSTDDRASAPTYVISDTETSGKVVEVRRNDVALRAARALPLFRQRAATITRY